MIVVQTRIQVGPDKISVEIDTLRREDSTEDEATVAYGIEQWILQLNQMVAETAGDELEIKYIGPQYEVERLREALKPFAKLAEGLPSGLADGFTLWDFEDAKLTAGDFRRAAELLK